MPKEVLPISCLGSVYIGSKLHEVKLAIDSLISHTIADQILIVVDGDIAKELTDFLHNYEDNNIIKCVFLNQNHGLGLALQEGLHFCKHEIVIRFDTDDINMPNRLEVIYETLITQPDVDIVGSYVNEFLPLCESKALICLKKVPLTHGAIKNALMIRNAVNHPSIGFRKSAILGIGSYQHMPLFEDYYLWLRARKYGLRFFNLKEPLVYMRRSDMMKRRSGWPYLVNEFNFLRVSIKERLIHPIFLIFFIPRLLSRIIPLKLQVLQNYLPWRSRLYVGNNPDII